ncbi:uncharacterized protein RHOBADRAFT_49181, partial [Rhodotorula graminis WP1]
HPSHSNHAREHHIDGLRRPVRLLGRAPRPPDLARHRPPPPPDRLAARPPRPARGPSRVAAHPRPGRGPQLGRRRGRQADQDGRRLGSLWPLVVPRSQARGPLPAPRADNVVDPAHPQVVAPVQLAPHALLVDAPHRPALAPRHLHRDGRLVRGHGLAPHQGRRRGRRPERQEVVRGPAALGRRRLLGRPEHGTHGDKVHHVVPLARPPSQPAPRPPQPPRLYPAPARRRQGPSRRHRPRDRGQRLGRARGGRVRAQRGDAHAGRSPLVDLVPPLPRSLCSSL